MANTGKTPHYVVFQKKPLPTIPYSPFEAPDGDILLTGSSDDDSDGTRQSKRQKREDACQYYLRHGVPKLISTAQLKGPFKPEHVARPKKKHKAVQERAWREERHTVQIEVPETTRPVRDVERQPKAGRSGIRTSHLSEPVHLLSSPAPDDSPTRARQTRKRPVRIGTEQAEEQTLKPKVAKIMRTSKLHSSDKGLTGVKDTKIQSHLQTDTARASCVSSPSRQPRKIRPTESPFLYVPTRLRRRQQEQVAEHNPLPQAPVNLPVNHQLLGKQGTNENHFVDALAASSQSVHQKSITQLSAPVTGGEHEASANDKVSASKSIPSPDRRASTPPLRLSMPKTSGWSLGFSTETKEQESSHVSGDQSPGRERLEAVSTWRGDETGKIANKVVSGDFPMLASRADETSGSLSGDHKSLSHVSSLETETGWAQNGQILFMPKPSTELLATEKPLSESRNSLLPLSTQAAFNNALASLHSPEQFSESERHRHSRLSLNKDIPTESLGTDDGYTQELALGTQVLLAKAPRFTISPGLQRKTQASKSLRESITSEKQKPPEEHTATGRSNAQVGSSECNSSPINIMQSAPGSIRKLQTPMLRSQNVIYLSKSLERFGSGTRSMSSKKAKSERTENKKRHSRSQQFGSQTQRSLSGRVTKSNSHATPAKSILPSTKASSDWQDAQRADANDFTPTGHRALSEDALEETIHDIQGFLSGWTPATEQ